MRSERYPLTSSPLYKIISAHTLAQVLQITLPELLKLEESLKSNPDKHYRIFTQGPKDRKIQHPIGSQIAAVHKRLKDLFARFQPPDYVQSGRKGISYVDNASKHQFNPYCMTMDIRKFYESSRGEAIFQFFFYKMKMASDLAWLITNIVTYQEPQSGRRKIPTGSPLSQLLAYWAYSNMFDQINQLALSVNAILTVYVDDMTFSSTTPIPDNLHIKVQELLSSRWLQFKTTKLRRFYAKDIKTITGCSITPDHNLTVPNKLKRKAIEAIDKALNSPEPTLLDIQKARGLVQSARQIEPGIFTVSLNQLKAKQKRFQTA